MKASELCVIRCTDAMADLERQLQHAMVAYLGGARCDVLSRPEIFLAVFARQDHGNRLGQNPMVEFQGVRLFFRQRKGNRRRCT
ncbi:hypothetical protein D1007_00737 [Hordeum vulgare]|nr:hypothetical protein D1007_00737 [Hordeum vulgare]KAI4972863.1 hypothetical protein ZWY2020_003788 [Hordeum vulgare]